MTGLLRYARNDDISNGNKIILGLDPGSLFTGFGLVSLSPNGDIKHITHGLIKLDAKKNISERLGLLAKDLTSIIAQYKPDMAIVENIFAYKNLRSALILGQARGAVLGILGLNLVEIFELSPTAIKAMIAGRGRAKKFQVAQIVALELGIDVPQKEDASDALAAALALAFLNRAKR